jgi:hypothetical protein
LGSLIAGMSIRFSSSVLSLKENLRASIVVSGSGFAPADFDADDLT